MSSYKPSFPGGGSKASQGSLALSAILPWKLLSWLGPGPKDSGDNNVKTSILEGEFPDSGKVLRGRWERRKGTIPSSQCANAGIFHIWFLVLEPQALGEGERRIKKQEKVATWATWILLSIMNKTHKSPVEMLYYLLSLLLLLLL